MMRAAAGRPRSATDEASALTRLRIRATGVVQGVGFRPFVHRLATGLDLTGFVGNDRGGVFIEVEGPRHRVEQFVAQLSADAPAMAAVESVSTQAVAPVGEHEFTIVASLTDDAGSAGPPGALTLVPADTATCAQCLAETLDPADRRYRYPFTACTYCGPRFTMVTGLPYDRPSTTMAGFPLCDPCRCEYEDPADRRFHAQPTACPACGPSLTFSQSGRENDGSRGDAALAAALGVLRGGGVVAVKGIGGYHLACDATRPGVVAQLRRRKQRSDKPFAVLVADLAAASGLVDVDEMAARELTSAVAPIVVLPVADRDDAEAIARSVAPGVGSVGVMLAHTPLHHLLFQPHPLTQPAWTPRALVFTSGNLADEPICTDADEAEQRLGDLADAFLHHDRPIHVACDDSVERVDPVAGLMPVRRSRGHAPLPVRLPVVSPPLVAVGGELKATVCVASGERAWLTQHLGDMASLATLSSLERALDVLLSLTGVTPEAMVADRHPGYLSQRWARERAAWLGVPCLLVQHHHAHVAALLTEHAVPPDLPVLGFAFDGTGFGDDATIWGGEVLLGSYAHVERVGHLAPVQLPGGDAAVRRPSRIALSHLVAAGLPEHVVQTATPWVDEVERRAVASMLRSGTGCVATTSMGSTPWPRSSGSATRSPTRGRPPSSSRR
jgi:hydrogenase maturation protein HypF